MAMGSTGVDTAPALGATEAAAVAPAGPRIGRAVLIGLALVGLLFLSTYTIAWLRAARLTETFMADADASYAAGNYLEALTGYEEFDRSSNTYLTRGGYMKALNIWASPRAWPQPDSVERARARIDEVLQEQLTIAEAEGFVQANIGQRNPFLGTIYLRLGELYEEEGDLQSARAIYDEIAELFPGEPELIARAEAHLARLGAE